MSIISKNCLDKICKFHEELPDSERAKHLADLDAEIARRREQTAPLRKKLNQMRLRVVLETLQHLEEQAESKYMKDDEYSGYCDAIDDIRELFKEQLSS